MVARRLRIHRFSCEENGRPTGNTSRDDNDVSTGQGLGETVISREETVNGGDGRDVREIGGDTGSVDDIVEREVVDKWAGLEEEGQRLANATSGSGNDCKARKKLC